MGKMGVLERAHRKDDWRGEERFSVTRLTKNGWGSATALQKTPFFCHFMRKMKKMKTGRKRGERLSIWPYSSARFLPSDWRKKREKKGKKEKGDNKRKRRGRKKKKDKRFGRIFLIYY
ncbi:hypothetical protein Pint_15723 [Pistacia integerrima]|uniref:Uncharacterized protein n=1 Tax=Pistacia integerrima TaxID=434235 RepID=A0ACC0ZE15_9ROSI|nr:hypothetical protein Pint_15723 [Pistacia integerrima]